MALNRNQLLWIDITVYPETLLSGTMQTSPHGYREELFEKVQREARKESE